MCSNRIFEKGPSSSACQKTSWRTLQPLRALTEPKTEHQNPCSGASQLLQRVRFSWAGPMKHGELSELCPGTREDHGQRVHHPLFSWPQGGVCTAAKASFFSRARRQRRRPSNACQAKANQWNIQKCPNKAPATSTLSGSRYSMAQNGLSQQPILVKHAHMPGGN